MPRCRFQRGQDPGRRLEQAVGWRESYGKPLSYTFSLVISRSKYKQAHALTSTLTSAPDNHPEFPFLTLLVSGGHTLLVLASSVSQFRILATTLDESIGRVFDKVSRMLVLPWSAKGLGASLEEFVAASPVQDDLALLMPRTMPGVLSFSFTGLHSAVERFVSARGGGPALEVSTKHALASAFQEAAVGQLEEKVGLALRWCRDQGLGVRHLVVSGGVASNSYLRDR